MKNKGCKFHPGCCIPDNEISNADELRERWDRKMSFMKSNGIPIIMKECQWKLELERVEKPFTSIPFILDKKDTEENLLLKIKNDEVFGFAICDVSCPNELVEELSPDGFLFPPIIERMTLNEENYSTFMRERITEENGKMEKTTVVQV